MGSATHHTSRGLRVGVAGVFLAGLTGLILLWQQGRAETPPFEPQIAAVFVKDQLQVGVGLERQGQKPLTGTLLVELVDRAGKSLARFEKDVNQEAAHAQYHGTLPVD